MFWGHLSSPRTCTCVTPRLAQFTFRLETNTDGFDNVSGKKLRYGNLGMIHPTFSPWELKL